MKLVVRTFDTDVDVVSIATLNIIKPDEVWVAFGAGVHFWLLVAGTRPLFHALAGCDKESSFAGIGKKTARVTWGIHPRSLKHVEN